MATLLVLPDFGGNSRFLRRYVVLLITFAWIPLARVEKVLLSACLLSLSIQISYVTANFGPPQTPPKFTKFCLFCWCSWGK